MYSCWGQQYVLIANDKRKWWSTAKMRASGGPAKWTPVSFMQMASNSGALSSPSSTGYVGCWWGYAWLWLFASFSFLLHYAIIFLSRCHLFSESEEYYNEHKNVSSYCRWTARAGEGDTGDKVKFIINLLPLVDFLGWFLIYIYIWVEPVSCCKYHLLHRAMPAAGG